MDTFPATVADVRSLDLRNQFKTIPDATIKCTLEHEALHYINVCAWGAKAALGHALVAAHVLALAQKGSTGPAGPVTGESAGGLSRSYASAGGSESDMFWQSTLFGRRYLQLRRTLALTPYTLHTPVIGIC